MKDNILGVPFFPIKINFFFLIMKAEVYFWHSRSFRWEMTTGAMSVFVVLMDFLKHSKLHLNKNWHQPRGKHCTVADVGDKLRLAWVVCASTESLHQACLGFFLSLC